MLIVVAPELFMLVVLEALVWGTIIGIVLALLIFNAD